MNKKIKYCFILGTRPEIIKFKPLIDKMHPYVLSTGQQKELTDCIKIKIDCNLNCSVQKTQSLSDYLASLIETIDKKIKSLKPEYIWVLGDTSTAYAGAFVAKMNHIKLVHVEAGLRTYDNNNPFPEEMFRRMIDSLSDILFAPTKSAVLNLCNERVQGKVVFSGNTVVDALNEIKNKSTGQRPVSEKYVLATVHRRESFGTDMIEIFKALKELSKTIKVIIPEHSNPSVKKAIKQVGIKTVEPMSYPVFLNYLEHCEYVLSDSGGVQEEAPSFNKKVVVLRKTTERPELIQLGYGILVKKMEAKTIFSQIKEFSRKTVSCMDNPFGNGRAADNIVKFMNNYETKIKR